MMTLLRRFTKQSPRASQLMRLVREQMEGSLGCVRGESQTTRLELQPLAPVTEPRFLLLDFQRAEVSRNGTRALPRMFQGKLLGGN